MNTLFSLMAEYGTAQIPLDKCAHLFGIGADEAAKRAKTQGLPIPAFRAGTQKSPWLVDASVLAGYLDALKAKAAQDWRRVRGAG
jgi:hypothetical protein